MPRLRIASASAFAAALFLLLSASFIHGQATQPYAWRNVVIKGGGFVTGITFHPTAPNLIYARTDVGGLFRWNAQTSSWLPITDWLDRSTSHLMGVDALALDPSDPNRIYAVGGQYVQSWAADASIMRSTDRGSHWRVNLLPFKMGGNEDGRSNGDRLAVDPNKNRLLLMGSHDSGLWRSLDFGSKWNKLTTFPVNATTNRVGIVFVQFVKSSGPAGTATPVIYVGVSDTTTHLYRTMDAGITWQAVAGQPTGMVPQHAALDANGTLYISYGNGPGPNGVTGGAVWKLDTVSGNWTNITPPTGQGGFGGLSLDAQIPGALVVSTIDRWFPRDEVYRSVNGGSTWTPVLSNGVLDNTPAPWSVSRTPHWLGDIEIDPANSNRALFVTGYGVWACDNLQSTETGGTATWTFRDDGLEETVPLALTSPPMGAPLLSALGDIGAFRHDNLDATPPIANYFSNRTTNTSIDFAQNVPAYIVRAHWGSARGSYSNDGGVTWFDFASRPATATQFGPNAIAVSADGQTLVWLPKGSIPYYSTNNGVSWQASTGGPTDPNSYQTMIPVADRVDSNRFYIYQVTTGNVYVSSNGGQSYTFTQQVGNSGGLPAASPGLQGHVWLPLVWNGLYRSTNSSASFSRVTSVQEAYQLGFGKPAQVGGYPSIYMWGRVNGMEGIFRSDDEAASWVRINDEQHQYGWINAIIGDPKLYGRVYLATGGRGIIYGDPLMSKAPDDGGKTEKQ